MPQSAFIVQVPQAEACLAALKKSGPIACVCSTVTLLENSSGRWQTLHTFDLPLPIQ